MSKNNPNDVISLLARRRDVLELIYNDVTEKRAIENELDISRPTVDRAFRQLDEFGLLEASGTRYSMSYMGEVIYKEYCDLYRIIKQSHKHFDILDNLSNEFDFPPDLLFEGTINRNHPKTPISPIEEDITNNISIYEEFRSFFPALPIPYMRSLHSLVTEYNMDGMIILDADIINSLSKCYDEILEELSHADNCQIRVSNDSIPYGMVCFDSKVIWLALFDTGPNLIATVTNHRQGTIDWACEMLRSQKRLSSPVNL